MSDSKSRAASSRGQATKAGAQRASATDKEPWKRKNPRTAKGQESTHLTPAQKATAKRHAKAAGRPYPNLVDNMQVAKAAKSKAKNK
ncbi:hypothetical protein [Pseudorhodoferax sp. Leaf274]|uniref:hypothetical protein n=1 Tax=Pseudorhodoferax sp. Leaf274 TaxID=1736318 RepID=UPI0009E7E914|nr:hypothetical protein [Pseudorhodoferax sp. Leaf274]